jgi:hypothetical protein
LQIEKAEKGGQSAYLCSILFFENTIFVPFFPWPFPIPAQKVSFIMCDLNDNATLQQYLFPSCSSSRFELLIGLSAQLVTAPLSRCKKRGEIKRESNLFSAFHTTNHT